MIRFVIVGFALFPFALCMPVEASERLPDLSFAMDSDPKLKAPEVQYGLPAAWKELWHDALTAAEENLRREAAIALMRLRQQDGSNISEMNSAMLEGFRTSTDQIVRLSMAEALIQFDVKEAADDLWKFVESGNIAVANRIEPALANWNYEPIRSEWLERIRNPKRVAATHLVLAAQGLAATGETSSVPDLLKLAQDVKNEISIRVAAAAAVGTLSSEGLTDVCRRLISDDGQELVANRIVAGKLLAGHSDDESKKLQLELAQDPEPAVAAVALEKLLDLDPEAVYGIRSKLLLSPDGSIRRLAAQSLASNSSSEAVEQLASLLNDRHPDVRSDVRQSLAAIASQGGMRDEVVEHVSKILSGEDWRGLEQAARLFGELDHEPAAQRLAALLKHPRAEVFVTAGWALRELAVAQMLPAMHEFVLDRSGPRMTSADNQCFTFLFEAFGQARFKPASPVLRIYVRAPPSGGGLGGLSLPGTEAATQNVDRPASNSLSRSAAIWALGYIHEEDPPKDLIREISGRLSAAAGYPPSEDLEVGIAAAVSLGRMKTLEPLESAAKIHGRGDLLYEACQWGIAHVTGNDQPSTPALRLSPRNPFLRPIER